MPWGRKGYVFTISAFLLLASLMLLAVFFSSDIRPLDITGPKLAMLYDDIRGDVVELLNLSVSVSEVANRTIVSFNDSMPSMSADYIANYERYIEMNYTGHVGGSIDDRKGSLAGADAELNLTDATLYIRPYWYAYGYDDLSKESIYSYPLPNSTGFEGYAVKLTLGSSLTDIRTDLAAGDLSLRLSLYGTNLTYDEYFRLSRNETSSFFFETAAGNFTIEAGRVAVRGGEETGAIRLSTDGVPADVLTTLAFNTTEHVSIETGFSIELRDISRKAFITDKIWFLR